MFEARDLSFGGTGVVAAGGRSRVVVKVPASSGRGSLGASDPSSDELLRMRHEAEALAKLDHPGFPRLRHLGRDAGRDYLVLDQAPGLPLRRLIAAGIRPHPQDAAVVFAGLCDALAHAHDRGVLHRDIKPSNVMLEGQDAVLVDFGLARTDRLHADLDRGHVLGTLPYMPLEAFGLLGSGQEVDERSELYALAATLFEWLCGEQAFGGANEGEILAAHRRGEVADPCVLAPRTPRSLGDVLLRALQREPADRYQTARGLAADLRRAAQETEPFALGLEDPSLPARSAAWLDRGGVRKRVLAAASRAAGGRGGVVWVRGEPGDGRTRLLEELVGPLNAVGALALAGRCPSEESELPGDGLVQALAHFRSQVPHMAPGEREERLAVLRRVLPTETGLLSYVPLGDLLGSGHSGVFSTAAEQPLEPADLCTAVLGTAARGRPTVVLLDDVDRADPTTRTALVELARAVAKAPVVLVLCSSSTGPTRGSAILLRRALWRAAGGRLETITLGELGEAQLGDLLGRSLDGEVIGADALEGWLRERGRLSPRAVVEGLRDAALRGMLRRTGRRWRFERPDAGEEEEARAPAWLGLLWSRLTPRGLPLGGRALLRRLAVPGPGRPLATLGAALAVVLGLRLGRPAWARPVLRRARRSAVARDLPWLCGCEGLIELLGGTPSRARALLEEALVAVPAQGDEPERRLLLAGLALSAQAQGDLLAFEEILRALARGDDAPWATLGLAWCARVRGEQGHAERLVDGALRVARQDSNAALVAAALSQRCRLRAARGAAIGDAELALVALKEARVGGWFDACIRLQVADGLLRAGASVAAEGLPEPRTLRGLPGLALEAAALRSRTGERSDGRRVAQQLEAGGRWFSAAQLWLSLARGGAGASDELAGLAALERCAGGRRTELARAWSRWREDSLTRAAHGLLARLHLSENRGGVAHTTQRWVAGAPRG